MNKFDYRLKDINLSLKKIGLRKGMDVFIHSNLAFFGKPNFRIKNNSLEKTFLEQILAIIGKKGNLIVPTFTYSFCKNKIYDPNKFKTDMGIFPEYILTRKNSLRSLDPIFSVCVIGDKKNYYTDVDHNNCFGPNSFWAKFLKNSGNILGLNFGSACTIFHYFEKKIGVPYRFDKKFSGKIKVKNKLVKEEVIFFCRKLRDKFSEQNFLPLEKITHKTKIKKIAKLGKGYVSLSNSKNCLNYSKKNTKKTIIFLQ